MKIAWSAGDEDLIIPPRDLFASLVSRTQSACSNGIFSDREKSRLYSNVGDHSLLLNVHAWQFVRSVLCGTMVGL